MDSLTPGREAGTLPIQPPTPYLHFTPNGSPIGRVLVVHGLDASKEVMQLFSSALADGGFEVFAIDLPGHGDSPAGFEASYAGEAILRAYTHLGEDTIVAGHSLGAGLLLDLAETRRFSTLVLLAPPPTPVSRLQAGRTLIVAGMFDLPRISAFSSILADLGGPDVEYWQLSRAAHSGMIFMPEYVDKIVQWLGGEPAATETTRRLVWILTMFASAIAIGVALLPGKSLEGDSAPLPTILVRYVAAAGTAILVLRFWTPLSFMRIFAMDYLVSFLAITGLILWIQLRPKIRFNYRSVGKAVLAAAFVIGLLGFGAASHVLHFSLWNGRWWRFPIMFAAVLPLLTADEFAIRRLAPRWRSAMAALITRTLLWAIAVAGVLLVNRESMFIVMIAHLLVVFWIFIWIATEIVHRHTRDPLASAVFAAIVQGWAYAAWFVTI